MFTIPNNADAAFVAQAFPDKVDVDMLVAGFAGTGVVGGCAVTEQGVPNMTVAVAAGTVAVLGVPAAVAGGNVTITAADATNPRFDLVVVSAAGVKSASAGTPAAAPAFPTIPASSVVLAAVYVPATDTAINANQITDKRVVVAADSAWTAPGLGNSWINYVGAGMPAGYRRLANGLVLVRGLLSSGVLGSAAFTLPAGYRPGQDMSWATDNGGVAGGYTTVGTAGAVTPAGGTNGYVRLDTIVFLAEA